MRTVLAVLTLFAATPAPAYCWDVGHFTDRLTDRQETYATVTPKGIAGEAGVLLYVGCTNGDAMPRLTFARRIGVYEKGASYRYDAGAIKMRIARLDEAGRTMWLWGANEWPALRRARRLRVQIGSEVMDFDLGAGGPAPGIACRG